MHTKNLNEWVTEYKEAVENNQIQKLYELFCVFGEDVLYLNKNGIEPKSGWENFLNTINEIKFNHHEVVYLLRNQTMEFRQKHAESIKEIEDRFFFG